MMMMAMMMMTEKSCEYIEARAGQPYITRLLSLIFYPRC